MKILSVIVINVISARIILYLKTNLSVRLLIECTVLEVFCPVSCKNCGDQYVGSATGFKTRFRIHKSDIETKKDRRGTARHFKNKCSRIFLHVQLIESVQSDVNLEGKLWEREKY